LRAKNKFEKDESTTPSEPDAMGCDPGETFVFLPTRKPRKS
jgi:hypothetical protein